MYRSSSLRSTFKTNLSKKNAKTLPRFWARWQEHVSYHVLGDLFLSPWMVHHTCYKVRFICPKDSEIWKIEIVPQKSTNDTVFKVFRVWWRINITADVFGRTIRLSTLSTFSHQPSPSFNIWFSISGDGTIAYRPGSWRPAWLVDSFLQVCHHSGAGRPLKSC